MGRNGKGEYDESSEADLIHRKVKFAIQSPRGGGGNQTNDRKATCATEASRVKKQEWGEGGRAMKNETLTCSPN